MLTREEITEEMKKEALEGIWDALKRLLCEVGDIGDLEFKIIADGHFLLQGGKIPDETGTPSPLIIRNDFVVGAVQDLKDSPEPERWKSGSISECIVRGLGPLAGLRIEMNDRQAIIFGDWLGNCITGMVSGHGTDRITAQLGEIFSVAVFDDSSLSTFAFAQEDFFDNPDIHKGVAAVVEKIKTLHS